MLQHFTKVMTFYSCVLYCHCNSYTNANHMQMHQYFSDLAKLSVSSENIHYVKLLHLTGVMAFDTSIFTQLKYSY